MPNPSIYGKRVKKFGACKLTVQYQLVIEGKFGVAARLKFSRQHFPG
jgi:hypothetical protein